MKDHTDNKTGIACLWMGVGSLQPSSARLRNKYDLQLCLHSDSHVEFSKYFRKYSTKEFSSVGDKKENEYIL